MRISDWSSDVCSSDLRVSIRRHEWLQAGQVGLAGKMNGEQWLDELGENILGFLAEYTNAQAGALFIKNGDAFIRRATYGTPADSNIPPRVRPAEGLIGQAIKDKRGFSLDAVPDNYLYFGSSHVHSGRDSCGERVCKYG